MMRNPLPVFLALGGLVACSPGATPRPSVILISIDTLRADHVGAYGYERDTTPFLDRFAEQSLLFERAFTPASWTLTAHATMLTGLQPDEHGILADGLAFSPETPLLAERLQAVGYRTLGLFFRGWINEERGFGRGFDVFQNHRNAEEAGAHLLSLLPQESGGPPLFLFLHLFDVHSQPFKPDSSIVYDSPEPHRNRFVAPDAAPLPELPSQVLWETEGLLDPEQREHLVALYDGAIHYVDTRLEQWFSELERRGLLENALVIVTADHGEALGQRANGRLHGHGGYYQEGLHVPLIVRLPDGSRAGERIQAPVQLGDLVPTILEVCGLAPDARLGGLSLREALPEDRIIDGARGSSRYALRWPEKYVDNGGGRVLHTDLSRDPLERANREVDAARLQSLVERARGERGPHPAPIPMGARSLAEEQQLRDLGYGGELDEELLPGSSPAAQGSGER